MGDDYNILNSINNRKSETYKVPEKYFDNLPELILLKIHAKNNTFSTPKSYFDGLADTILAKIKVQQEKEVCEEIKEFAPILASLQQKQVYQVPHNYFNNLAFNLPVKPQVKVIQFKRRFTYLKYASAAVIVTFIAISGLFNNNTPNKSLAMYHQTKQINVEESITHLSDVDLNKVFDEEQLIAYQSTNSTTTLPWDNLDNLDVEMQYVTDDEMDAYIKENNLSIN